MRFIFAVAATLICVSAACDLSACHVELWGGHLRDTNFRKAFSTGPGHFDYAVNYVGDADGQGVSSASISSECGPVDLKRRDGGVECTLLPGDYTYLQFLAAGCRNDVVFQWDVATCPVVKAEDASCWDPRCSCTGAPPAGVPGCSAKSFSDRISWVNWHTVSAPNQVKGTASMLDGTTVDVTFDGQYAFLTLECSGNEWWNNGETTSHTYHAPSVGNSPAELPSNDAVKVAAPHDLRCDQIHLSTSGPKKLTLSRPMGAPVVAYQSWNGNGITFDQEFDIIAQGTGTWGCGCMRQPEGSSTSMSMVPPPECGTTYNPGLCTALYTEPHGLFQFKQCGANGSQEYLWTNHANEFWHGFTIGFPNPKVIGD